jgi:prepilin-type N-terminal cleavage/methylation domain-containing protein
MNILSWKYVSARRPQHAGEARGFSLLELMVAMAMFMVIGAAAMTLIKAHMPMASSSANQAGLTMNLRNSLAQIELDAVNAGAGYYPGVNVSDWPVGFTIVNQDETVACNSGGVNDTFGANCFDTLNIISGDPTVVPLHPAVGVNTDTTGSVSVTVPATTTAAALAASFHTGDELLWLGTASPSLITTTVLTGPGVPNGATVTLTFNKTTGGLNTTDPYLIAKYADSSYTNALLTGSTFTTSDWIIKLSPITYWVDYTTTPANPKLMRSQGGNKDVVAEQIIGFRVGAAARFNTTTTNYLFNASGPSVASGCTTNCGYNNDWAQVRAIRVSVIGRTPPNSDLATNYHNSFDGGPYKIQGLSVTINPRNLSMTDQ